MDGEKKKTPIGRIDRSKSPMVYQTSAKTMAELIKSLSASTRKWGMIVKDVPAHADGSVLSMRILLADGRAALKAKVEVRRPKGIPDARMALVIQSMDPSSQVAWNRIQDIRRKSRDHVSVSANTPSVAQPDSPRASVQAKSATEKNKPSDMPALVSGEILQTAPDPNAVPIHKTTPATQDGEDSLASMVSPNTQPIYDEAQAVDDEAQAVDIEVSQKPRAWEGLEKSLHRMVLMDEDRDLDKLCLAPEDQQQAKGPIIGIDLGTTNSCCAIVKNGRPFVIPSRRGHNTIPSVVAINEIGDELVGHAAKAQMEINPGRTIYGSKRLVGRPFDSPVVREVSDRFHYKIVQGPDNSAAVQIDDQVLTLEEVSAKILTDIRDTAQEYLGGYVERAVITVPAFFNENQRHAVRRAGELAGFRVERVLNEPTAAAITFGMKSEGDMTLMVYDLGGGTFDATLLEIKGDSFEVLSTGGDTFLGGVDFDNQLMDHLLIEFQLSLGKMPEIDRIAYMRVLQGAEFAKRTLSSKNEARIALPFIGRLEGKPVNLDLNIDRKTLESLVSPLVNRTMDVCEAVLAQRGLGADVVDNILLVGGQTRMPMIWEKIHELFGKEPLKGVHPDESVAIGAALMGESIDKKASFKLVDVLPMSIGVGVPGGIFRKVLTGGTSLPASRTYGLYTYIENQTKMVIPVYQGESSKVDENELLGVVELSGIEPVPAGGKMIEITFGLTQECLLKVSAQDRDGGSLTDVQLSTRDSMLNLLSKMNSVVDVSSSNVDHVHHEPNSEADAGQVLFGSDFREKVRQAWSRVKGFVSKAKSKLIRRK